MIDYKPIAEELLDRIALSFKWFTAPEEKEKYEKLVAQWERSLKAAGMNYPPNIYGEALDLIIANASSRDDAPMPGDILRACGKVIERIESDPVRRKGLYEWREKYRLARIEQMTGEPQRLD